MSTDRFGRHNDRGDLEHGGGELCQTALQCKIRSYAQFSRWLDGELAKLERHWAHLAVHPRQTSDRPFFPDQPR